MSGFATVMLLGNFVIVLLSVMANLHGPALIALGAMIICVGMALPGKKP